MFVLFGDKHISTVSPVSPITFITYFLIAIMHVALKARSVASGNKDLNSLNI
jgi:hypothetical protein